MPADAEPGRAPGQGARRTTPFDAALLERVLRPYRDNVHYVRTAALTVRAESGGEGPRPDDPGSWITVDGQCSIPGSCYIDDTGHFNAVELNITYNQMLYTGLAAATRDGLIPALSWDLDDFFVHQLPDVLIIDYHARFPRPLDPRSFGARFEIREVIPKPKKRMVLIKTYCTATCGTGGHAEADVTVALVNT